MLRLGPWRLYALLLSLGLSSQPHAADFTCVANPALGKLIKSEWYTADDIDYWGAFKWEIPSYDECLGEVAIEGKIIPGDADKLEWLLARPGPNHPFIFLIQSPGGDLLEAMTMGRLLRTQFAQAYSRKLMGDRCGAPGQPICCASSCAFVYFGAASWRPTDRLGLHRPSLENSSEKTYSSARKSLEDINTIVSEYLDEMEIDAGVFDAMMRAGPDQISIWVVGKTYPPSLQDWLTAKCETHDSKDFCMGGKLQDLSHDQHHLGYTEAKRFSWYPYKSTDELNKMLDGNIIGPIRRAAIENELDKREKDQKPH
ncbi:MAG: hypothetical protein WBX25_08410 [Rhodomicrobium sp.]